MLIDSHCHLSSSQFDLDREEVIRRSLENNVKYVISVGGSLKNCEKTIELAESFDSVYAVIGIHLLYDGGSRGVAQGFHNC